MGYLIIPAQAMHIPIIAADMREADRCEVMASHGHTPEQALAASLVRSPLAWTCVVDGAPAFMWGVARAGSLLSFTGRPWLLGTPAILTVQRQFLRQSRSYVARMQDRFPRLENWVHADNRASMRWLRWCGFTISAEPESINGNHFYRFWREKYYV